MGNRAQIIQDALEAHLMAEGWTIDRQRWPHEAVMPSGYGEGPAVIQLQALAEAIESAIDIAEGT
jgi:hypothetical protein